jgi:hypothetical protein
MFFGESAVHFRYFLLCCASQRSARTQVTPQVATHQEIGSQLWAWGDSGFEPWTTGQQSGALPLSHHASLRKNYRLVGTIAVGELTIPLMGGTL